MSECLNSVRVNGALGLVCLPKCRHLVLFKLPWVSPLSKRSGRYSTGCRETHAPLKQQLVARWALVAGTCLGALDSVGCIGKISLYFRGI